MPRKPRCRKVICSPHVLVLALAIRLRFAIGETGDRDLVAEAARLQRIEQRRKFLIPSWNDRYSTSQPFLA